MAEDANINPKPPSRAAPGSEWVRLFTVNSCPPCEERTGLNLQEAICLAEWRLHTGASKVAIFEDPCVPNAEVSDGGGPEAPEIANRCRPPPFAQPKS